MAAQLIDGATLALGAREEVKRRVARHTAAGRPVRLSAVLVGSTPTDEREETLDGLRDGTIRVVVASTVADEGLDVRVEVLGNGPGVPRDVGSGAADVPRPRRSHPPVIGSLRRCLGVNVPVSR